MGDDRAQVARLQGAVRSPAGDIRFETTEVEVGFDARDRANRVTGHRLEADGVPVLNERSTALDVKPVMPDVLPEPDRWYYRLRLGEQALTVDTDLESAGTPTLDEVYVQRLTLATTEE